MGRRLRGCEVRGGEIYPFGTQRVMEAEQYSLVRSIGPWEPPTWNGILEVVFLRVPARTTSHRNTRRKLRLGRYGMG